MHVVVACAFCELLISCPAGCSPKRPGPCDGARPPPVPIIWATRRYDPLASYHWLVRGR